MLVSSRHFVPYFDIEAKKESISIENNLDLTPVPFRAF